MAVKGQRRWHHFDDEVIDSFAASSPRPWAFPTCEYCSGDHDTKFHGWNLYIPDPIEDRVCQCGTILSLYNHLDCCACCERAQLIEEVTQLNTNEDSE